MKEKKKFFTVQELASMVGVSTSSLRAWERRYALFSPERTEGGHRLYTQDDLKLFWYVSHLRGQGLDLKDIASQGRSALCAQAEEFFRLNAGTASCSSLPSEGGVGGVSEFPYQDILAALHHFDFSDAIANLERHYALATDARRFADLAVDIMIAVGDAWHRGDISVAAEHAMTQRVKHMLLSLLYSGASPFVEEPPSSQEAPTALLSTLPEELHELGLMRVGIHLHTWGWKTHYLGANTPLADLEACVCRTQAKLVCLSVTQAMRPTQLMNSLRKVSMLLASRCVIVVGGAGTKALTSHHPELAHLLVLEDLSALHEIANHIAAQKTFAPLEIIQQFKELTAFAAVP